MSGDRFLELPDGSRRWGRYGAAGVLVRFVDGDGVEYFFLAQRSEQVHGGKGMWAIPGGALSADESAHEAALREFAEEIEIDVSHVTVLGEYVDDHFGVWSYTTVVGDVDEMFDPPKSYGWETSDARWFTRAELDEVPKHGGFAATLAEVLAIFDEADGRNG